MTPTRTRRGFTFLELMVVIAIMAVLIAFVVPNMAGPRERAALRSASRSLASAGLLARQLSISYGEETTLILRPQENEWQLEVTPRTLTTRSRRADKDKEPLTEEEAPQALPKQVTINSVKTNNVEESLDGELRLTFFPNGSCSGMTIEVKNSREKSMTVDFERATGRPDVYIGPPKSLGTRLKEQGLNPETYGLVDDSPLTADEGAEAGEGFTKVGQTSDQRVEAYKDAVQRMLERSKTRYEVIKSGDAREYYAGADQWGK